LIHNTLSEQGHKEQNRPLYELGDEYIFENDNLKVPKKLLFSILKHPNWRGDGCCRKECAWLGARGRECIRRGRGAHHPYITLGGNY
jgi:hypothetical protein